MTARVGEGPVWDPVEELLLWVDIPPGLVHTTSLQTRQTTTHQLPMQVGAVAPAAAGGLVVACEQGFGAITADGSFELRLPVLTAGERMNDAKCDAAGRLWAGSTEMSFAAGRGALHALSPDWRTDIVLDGLTLPNGMGWSPDSTVYYLADSEQRVILAFDFDLRHGALSRRRTLIAFAEEDGKPDGLCIDSAGSIWVAMWGTSRLLRISPLGAIQDVVPMPVRQPSSCMFGGRALDVLYVTSASEGLDLAPGGDDLDGSIFAITGTGSTGTVPTPFGPGPEQ
jgi:sugar lactone lactonase YvrE